MSTNLLEQQEALEIKFAEAEEELFALRKTVETLEEYRKSIKVRPWLSSFSLAAMFCTNVLPDLFDCQNRRRSDSSNKR